MPVRTLRQLQFDVTIAVDLVAELAIHDRERSPLLLMLARGPVDLVTFHPEGDRGPDCVVVERDQIVVGLAV